MQRLLLHCLSSPEFVRVYKIEELCRLRNPNRLAASKLSIVFHAYSRYRGLHNPVDHQKKEKAETKHTFLTGPQLECIYHLSSMHNFAVKFVV
ncbi:unnamed protein product [Schistosoma bovis]|nr:unnamed protein product [Schistosoma bovis]